MTKQNLADNAIHACTIDIDKVANEIESKAQEAKQCGEKYIALLWSDIIPTAYSTMNIDDFRIFVGNIKGPLSKELIARDFRVELSQLKSGIKIRF